METAQVLPTARRGVKMGDRIETGIPGHRLRRRAGDLRDRPTLVTEAVSSGSGAQTWSFVPDRRPLVEADYGPS